MTEAEAISKFISDYGFGTLVSSDLSGTHLPLIFEPEEGELGCLYGHSTSGCLIWTRFWLKSAIRNVVM
ncbi:FMN-binding negative transcriptional regulator [Idiomarina loihiensis]|uniref:FMN-binding negative transcriptional regulator n=1 Tax=Idiomarina loihiensis TaxID=135577 RepID=UPI00384AE46A